MKYFLPFLVLMLNCNQNHDSENTAASEAKLSEKIDLKNVKHSYLVNDSSWIIAFRGLRDDIYQKRPENFVEFPFIDKHESIWYLIESLGNENKYNKRSISNQEFVKYYYDIFSKDFIGLLLKTKSDSLFKHNHYVITKTYSDTLTYRLNVEFNPKDRLVSLSLGCDKVVPIENGEHEKAEYSECFIFYLINDRFLLKEIVLAG